MRARKLLTSLVRSRCSSTLLFSMSMISLFRASFSPFFTSNCLFLGSAELLQPIFSWNPWPGHVIVCQYCLTEALRSSLCNMMSSAMNHDVTCQGRLAPVGSPGSWFAPLLAFVIALRSKTQIRILDQVSFFIYQRPANVNAVWLVNGLYLTLPFHLLIQFRVIFCLFFFRASIPGDGELKVFRLKLTIMNCLT